MNKTLEIINGISQAVSNKHDGSREDDGKGDFQKIGLKREEISFGKRSMDGFGVSMVSNKLKLSYHSEINLKDVYDKKFEDNIIDTMSQCISYIKKEYKKITKKSLSLKMIDEPVINVENMNKKRSWVTAYCLYKIEGIDEPEKLGKTMEERLEDNVKKWIGLSKGK